MAMKVKVISMETIKPSSPTPSHLSTFKLSLLDLFASAQYIPVILFFDSDPTQTSQSQSESESDHLHHLLKRSLSDVLTRFYPLAGRIKDNNIFVDCNDLGVDYFEAKVNGTIFEFKNPDVLHQLLPPPDFISFDLARKVPLVVQVNTFDCGGIAISVCMSHKISDASSITTFINGWATTARGASELVTPTFDTPSLFPVRPLSFPVSDTAAGNGGDTAWKKLVTKGFVFDAAKVASLRTRIADSSTTADSKYPTRVEAVSALIWKSLMTKSGASSNPAAPISILNHVVNLRGRMDPPLTQESFGNILWMATAIISTTAASKNSHSMDELVGHMRVAISKINGDYVKKLQGDDDDVIKSMLDETGLMKEAGQVKADMYMISSWCKFPFYEYDFGWGMPVWVTCSPGQALGKNGVILMDTKCGEGIQAWVKLEEEDMAEFERNEDLLEFVSINN